ncbi:triose-phosphate isomerase [Candidatus Woesearchaeota archaeon]|nr:triose-phosphate isomerase [Candidatus Woesearchaeota archaeon]
MTSIGVPLLLVNCKNYGQTAVLAERIARAGVTVLGERQASGKKRVTIALAVPAADINHTAGLGLVPVFSEHLDPHRQGATTGHVIAEDVQQNGGVGSLINHSEDPMGEVDIRRAVVRAREAGLTSVVCVKDAQAAAHLASYGPDFVAVEPPELIGGDVSVSTARPELVSDTVAAVKQVKDVLVLVGAGVKDAADVRKGLELGASGVLVASGVTKAEDIIGALRELAAGFD